MRPRPTAPFSHGALPLHRLPLLLLGAFLIRPTHAHARPQSHGHTPLRLAAYLGKLDVVRLLLDGGADATAKDTFGKTPLDWAREKKHASVVALLEEAAKPSASLHDAAKAGDAAGVQRRLAAKADVNERDVRHARPPIAPARRRAGVGAPGLAATL